MSAFSPYPDRQPPPPPPHSTPLEPIRSAASAAPAAQNGVHSTRKPVYNPYDKFSAEDFDDWINNITGALRNALGQDPASSQTPQSATTAAFATHEDDEVARHRAQIYNATRNGVSSRMTSESDDDAEVEDSFAEIVARKARGNKGKARDPREGPGLRPGANRLQPIEIVSSDEEDEKEVEMSIVLDEERSDAEGDEEDGSDVFGSEDEEQEEEEEGDEAGSGEEYEEDEEEEEEERWPGEPSTSQNIRHGLVRSRPTLYKDEVDEEEEGEEEDEGQEEGEGEEYDEEYDEEEDDHDSRPAHRATRIEPEVIELSDSEEEQEHHSTQPQRVDEEDEAEEDDYEEHAAYSQPQPRPYPGRVSREDVEEDFLSGDEDADADEIYPPPSHTFAHDDSAFIPSRASPEDDEDDREGIQLPDVWSGPRAYAEDYYAGGDRFVGHQSQGQSQSDPHHIGSGDEGEYEDDADEVGYDGEEAEFQGEGHLQYQFHPQHHPQGQVGEEDDDDEIEILEPGLPPQPFDPEAELEDDAIDDDDVPAPELADNWRQASMYADDLYTDGDVIIPPPTVDVLIQPLDKPVRDDSNLDTSPASNDGSASITASTEPLNPHYLLGSASAPSHTHPTTFHTATRSSFAPASVFGLDASAPASLFGPSGFTLEHDLPLPVSLPSDVPPPEAVSASASVETNSSLAREERERNMDAFLTPGALSPVIDQDEDVFEGENGPGDDVQEGMLERELEMSRVEEVQSAEEKQDVAVEVESRYPPTAAVEPEGFAGDEGGALNRQGSAQPLGLRPADLDAGREVGVDLAPKEEEEREQVEMEYLEDGEAKPIAGDVEVVDVKVFSEEGSGDQDQDQAQDQAEAQPQPQTHLGGDVHVRDRKEDPEEGSMFLVPPSATFTKEHQPDEKEVSIEQEAVQLPQSPTLDIAQLSPVREDAQGVERVDIEQEHPKIAIQPIELDDDDEEEDEEEEDQLASSPPEGAFARDDDAMKEAPTAVIEVESSGVHDDSEVVEPGSENGSDRTPRPMSTPEAEEVKTLPEHNLQHLEAATLESEEVQKPVGVSATIEGPTMSAEAVMVEGDEDEDTAGVEEPIVAPDDSTIIPEPSKEDSIQPDVEVVELDNFTDALGPEAPVATPPEHTDQAQDSMKDLDIREVSFDPSSHVGVEEPVEVVELDSEAEKEKDVIEEVVVDEAEATPLSDPGPSDAGVPVPAEERMQEGDELELEYVDGATVLGTASCEPPISTGSTPEMLVYPAEILSPVISELEGVHIPASAATTEEHTPSVRKRQVEMEGVFDDEDERAEYTFQSGPPPPELEMQAELPQQHSDILQRSNENGELEIEEEPVIVITEDNEELERTAAPAPAMDYTVSEPVTEMEADENLGVTDDDADGELDLEVEVLSVRSTSSLGEAPQEEAPNAPGVQVEDDAHAPEVQEAEGVEVEQPAVVVDFDTGATAEPDTVVAQAPEPPASVTEPALEAEQPAEEEVKTVPVAPTVEHAPEGDLELLEDIFPSLGNKVEEDKKTSTDLDFSEFIADSVTSSPKVHKPAEMETTGVAAEVTQGQSPHNPEDRLLFIEHYSDAVADLSYYDPGSPGYLAEHTAFSQAAAQEPRVAAIEVTNNDSEAPLEELEPVLTHDADPPKVTKHERTPPPPEEILHADDPFKLMGTESQVAPGEVKDDPGLVGVEASPSASPPDVATAPDQVPKLEPETTSNSVVTETKSESPAKEETPVVNESLQDQHTDSRETGSVEGGHKHEAEEEAPAASSQTKKRKRVKSPSSSKRNGGASKGKGKRTKSPLKKSTAADNAEPASDETIVVKPRHGLKRSSLSTLAYDKNSEATPMDASSSTSAYRLLVPGPSRASSSTSSEKSAPSPTVDKPFPQPLPLPPPVAAPLLPAVASQPFIHAHGAAKKRAKLSQPQTQRGNKRQAVAAAAPTPPAPLVRDLAPAPLAPPSRVTHSATETIPTVPEPGPSTVSVLPGPPVTSTTAPPSTPTSTTNEASSAVTPTSVTPTTQSRTPRASQLTSAASLPVIPASPSKPLAASPSLSALKSSAASSSSPRHSPISSSLITRSHCRYHRISIPKGEDGPRIFFLVPGCSLTNRELMIEEEIEDHGDATHEDSTKMLNDIETLDLDEWLISVLRHLVGPDIMREQEVFCLPQDGEVILRKPPKRKSERASFVRQSTQHDSSSRASPPVSVAGSTSTSRSVVRRLLDSEHESTASWSTSASEWEESEEEDESPAKRAKIAHATDKDTPSAPSASMGPPPSVEHKRKPRKMKVADMAYIPPPDHATEMSDGEQPKRKPRRKSTATSVASSSTTATPNSASTTKRGVKRSRNEKAPTAEEGQSEPKPKRARKPKNAPAPLPAAPPQSPVPIAAPAPPSPTASRSQPQLEQKVQTQRTQTFVPPAPTLAPTEVPVPSPPLAAAPAPALAPVSATPPYSVDPAPSNVPPAGVATQSQGQDSEALPTTQPVQPSESAKGSEVPVSDPGPPTATIEAGTQPSTHLSAHTSAQAHAGLAPSTTDPRTMGHYANIYRSMSSAQTISSSQLNSSSNTTANPYSAYNPYYSLAYQNQPTTASGQTPYARHYQQWPVPTSTSNHPWSAPLNVPLWYPVMYRNPTDAIASATYYDPSATQQPSSSSASGSGSGPSDEHVAPSDVFGDSHAP